MKRLLDALFGHFRHTEMTQALFEEVESRARRVAKQVGIDFDDFPSEPPSSQIRRTPTNFIN
jgi:hypothetical protein